MGGDASLGQPILAIVPAQVKTQVEPFVPNIVTGIYEAISLAIASVFWLGVVTAVLAFVAALLIRELPLRTQLAPVRGAHPAASGAVGVPAAPVDPASGPVD